jgi:hypothetical protein
MKYELSEEQQLALDDLIEWILLLKDEPGFTNRLKIWKKLKDDGASGTLLLEAFRKTGLFTG